MSNHATSAVMDQFYHFSFSDCFLKQLYYLLIKLMKELISVRVDARRISMMLLSILWILSCLFIFSG